MVEAQQELSFRPLKRKGSQTEPRQDRIKRPQKANHVAMTH